MRTMQWTDAFLETDTGIKKALGGRTSKEMYKMAEAWRPWRNLCHNQSFGIHYKRRII